VTKDFSVIQWVLPSALILGGLLIGLFVDKFALSRLEDAVARTKWNGDEIVVNALRGMPILWLTKLFVYLIGSLIILQTLNISITPILTALGVGGLAVALALQDTLSNLFSGLQIIASKQVRPGDYVKLESGEEGYVTDITWRNTAIRALPNNMVIVPNSKLASTLVTNYYQPEFEPFIRYHTFADFSVNFSVILRAGEFTDQFMVKHEFIKRLHERYQQEGIEIPFPIRTLQFRKEK
jgi:small-conductance mechanosensitive channel